MKRIRKKICIMLIVMLLVVSDMRLIVYANEDSDSKSAGVVLQSPSAILMEASTGTVIYEKNSDEIRSPASITKIMTLLLTFEALDKGRIKLDDEVVTSAYAQSMGGSQVFLEEGEVQTVDTLIKCIAVSSGNDASVAMAEHIGGSEQEFVNMMNEKAALLGMDNTHFIDCCGLSSDTKHYTTARDVAIMSKELITKYPQIYDYTQIWMEDITHNTNKGASQFTLSSTNKLLKQYQWTTGLKTGSTSTAKYCFSATASKDGIDLIAVIMGAPDFKIRFAEAKILLEYGFSTAKIYTDENLEKLNSISVKGGKQEFVDINTEREFRYLDVTGMDFGKIQKNYKILSCVEAPVKKGDIVGKVVYNIDDKEIGSVNILASENIEKFVFSDCLKKIIFKYML